MRSAVFIAAFAVVVGGCKKREAPSPPPMEAVDALEIREDAAVLQTGPVGAGSKARDATYALVDVVNKGDSAVVLHLGGSLKGRDGQSVSKARTERLIVPGHGVRTFALVADPPRPLPGAAGVSAEIKRSEVHSHPPAVVIEEGHVYADHGKVVAKAYAANKRRGTARAVVIAGFYDERGRPMARGMEVFVIDGGQRAGVEFVGPRGSKSGYIFVGDVVY